MRLNRASILSAGLALIVAASGTIAPAVTAVHAEDADIIETQANDRKDRSKLARLIITTDVECDDMNGLISTALFSGDMDIVGIVRSAGEWHWDGDRDPDDYSVNLGTTLEEVMKDYITEENPYPWRCRGEEPFAANYVTEVQSGPVSKTAGALTHYREANDDWLTELWDVHYRAVYPNLVKHDPSYPTPDYMLSITKRGNVAFESDLRYDTEGSDWIKNIILDDDPRPLVVSVMGGANTFVRALLSIYEEYHDTDQWEEVLNKVNSKLVASYYGEDDAWTRSGIRNVYSFATQYRVSGASGLSSYGSPDLTAAAGIQATDWLWSTAGTNYETNHFYQGEWLSENIKLNHGPLTGLYYTMLDEQYIGHEPRIYQWTRTGIHNPQQLTAGPYPGALEEYLDEEGTVMSYGPGWGRMYAKYDWTGHQGTGLIFDSGMGAYNEANDWGHWGVGYGGYSGTHAGIPATRNNMNYATGATARNNQMPFQRALWEEIAGRADWCVAENYEDANHPPVVTIGANETSEDHFVYAKAGDTVTLKADVTDPDGDQIYTHWFIYPNASNYQGSEVHLTPANPAAYETVFTVPADAKPGEYFNFVCQARDSETDAPMSRFNNVVVHVVEELPEGSVTAELKPATEANAKVTMEKDEITLKPAFATYINAEVQNDEEERVYMFWKVNEEASVYSGSMNNIRVWDPYNYTTGFTAPADAADGDVIVLEMWGGKLGEEPVKYAEMKVNIATEIPDEPKITSVTCYPQHIYQNQPADITVTVEGENLSGHTVRAEILGKRAEVVNGKAVIHLDAEDVFEYGTFNTQITVSDTWIKYNTDPDSFIYAYAAESDIMEPVVSVEGEDTVITFGEESQAFNEEDGWNKYPVLDLAFNEADQKVTVDGEEIDPANVIAEGNTITLKGVDATDLLIVLEGVSFGDLYLNQSFRFEIGEKFEFDDVADPERYFYEPVYWAYNHKPQITKGTSEHLFSPDANVTRGQMVTFLWRLAGEPEPEGEAKFNDVKADRYFAKAVAWAAENEITTGYADGSGNFGPDDNCTREQIVTFLWRYAKKPAAETTAEFTDTRAGAYYLDALSWAAENEITLGLNDGTGRFGVGMSCTRAMAVTFLYRASN